MIGTVSWNEYLEEKVILVIESRDRHVDHSLLIYEFRTISIFD